MSKIEIPHIASATRGTRHVFIRNLELPAHIGVYRQEEGRTQPVRINVDLATDEIADAQDMLENVAMALGEASHSVSQTTQGVDNIAQAVNEQKAASNDIAHNVEKIAQMTEENMGSSIDDFMKAEAIFEESQAKAILLKTSRTQVNRLLDGKDDVTLSNLQRAAAIVGRRVSIELL